MLCGCVYSAMLVLESEAKVLEHLASPDMVGPVQSRMEVIGSINQPPRQLTPIAPLCLGASQGDDDASVQSSELPSIRSTVAASDTTDLTEATEDTYQQMPVPARQTNRVKVLTAAGKTVHLG